MNKKENAILARSLVQSVVQKKLAKLVSRDSYLLQENVLINVEKEKLLLKAHASLARTSSVTNVIART